MDLKRSPVLGVGRSETKLKEVGAELGDNVVGKPVDLSTGAGGEAAIEAAVSAFGTVDVLVNDAGVGYSYRDVRPGSMQTVADTTIEDRDHVMSINLGSVVHCSRPANTLYTVLPGDDAAAARTWVTSLRAALPAQLTLFAGISGASAAEELPAARREADECLALHETREPGSVASAYEEAWDDILLQRLRTAARTGRTPARGPVAELRRHDHEHATKYVATLRAWLAAQGDPATAGRRLGVHENTIRYRLRKMAELTTLDLHDDKRLAMMIEPAALNDRPSPHD